MPKVNWLLFYLGLWSKKRDIQLFFVGRRCQKSIGFCSILVGGQKKRHPTLFCRALMPKVNWLLFYLGLWSEKRDIQLFFVGRFALLLLMPKVNWLLFYLGLWSKNIKRYLCSLKSQFFCSSKSHLWDLSKVKFEMVEKIQQFSKVKHQPNQ
jgi:hypothetical protein